MTVPSVDIRSHLNGQTLDSTALVEGTNLFSSLPFGPDSDTDAALPVVFVWDGVGAPPIAHMGVTRSLFYPSVQVRVRVANNDMPKGRTLADAILKALHRAEVSGYISCVARESAPIDLGQNDSAQHEFGLNIDLIYGA